jgi:signal peptidase I
MTEPQRRSVGVAVLLGLLVPGLGQAYGGNIRRALLWFLGAVGLGTLTIRAMLTSQRPPFNLALPIGLLFAYYVVEIVDAARTTARNATRPARAYERWWVWAGVVALFLLVVQPTVTDIFRRAGQGFVFTANSMTPTLLRHDYVMVDKTSTRRARGEVIAFELDVSGRRQLFVFRVIGLGGDHVAVRGGRAVVNGAPMDEPYATLFGTPPADFQTVTVPGGRLFVLGDNRGTVVDSRAWGFVPEHDVIGRVNLVYFSQEPYTGAIRWERIGLPVR